jgi:ATP-dependent DNA helicase PIF1
LDIVLSAEQKALLKTMEGTRQHLFITGRAGAGKSVLLRHFREQTAKRVVVAAPTGIAALNVQGQTLHSLFKLAPKLHRSGDLAPNSRVCSLLKRIDTLVIDEISMVRADLLDAVDERFREAFNNEKPFGGVQIIMFGDVYQLPPVVEEGLVPYFEAVHQGHFFFNALVWRKTEFKVYELSQVFRQKDPVFKDVLNAVRDGSVVDSQIAQLNVRSGIAIPPEGTITLAPTNALVTNINQERLDLLPGEVREYQATISGEMKRSTFPTEERLQLKKGAQVVMLKNDKDSRWVNGSVGIVEDLLDDKINVRVGGIVYALERETWEEIAYSYDHDTQKVEAKPASSFTQYPVRLAWALTIHKSQGQTYDQIALDLTTATFAAGQLYVALSRATSLEGLYLKVPVKREYVMIEPKVTEFMGRREAIAVVEETEDLSAEETKAIVEAEANAVIEEAEAVAEAVYEEGSDAALAFMKEAQALAELLRGESSEGAIAQALKPTVLPDEDPGVEQSLVVMASASIESVTVEPLDSDAVEQSNGEAVMVLEAQPVPETVIELEAQPVPLVEGRIARIAAIEILCPTCGGLCVDPATGAATITHDLVGHSIVCSRCKQACIVPLNAFSLEGIVVAREKPEQNVSNAKREKKGRTKKERKSNAGAKAHGKEPKQPLQLSLDMRIIQTLKTWGVNASALYKELLAQYDPFLQQYREVIGEEFGEEESDEEEDE